MRPEIRFAQQLEEMPVKLEYRAAVAAGIEALRRPVPKHAPRTRPAPRPAPIDRTAIRLERLAVSHQLREERRLREEREAGYLRVIQGHRQTESELQEEIARLRELVHPAGTWIVGNSPRRRKLKSLYCSWRGHWRWYRNWLIELARGDEARGFRWYPDNDRAGQMLGVARAFFDAAMEIARELDEHEAKSD